MAVRQLKLDEKMTKQSDSYNWKIDVEFNNGRKAKGETCESEGFCRENKNKMTFTNGSPRMTDVNKWTDIIKNTKWIIII